jgi:hypothetical protein
MMLFHVRTSEIPPPRPGIRKSCSWMYVLPLVKLMGLDAVGTYFPQVGHQDKGAKQTLVTTWQ